MAIESTDISIMKPTAACRHRVIRLASCIAHRLVCLLVLTGVSVLSEMVIVPGLIPSAAAKAYDIGTEDAAEFQTAEVVDNPSPQIPPELKEDGYQSSCVARFSISADGKTKVKLVTSSGSDEIDDITLSTLRRWKFKPATLDGKPVPSTRRMKIEFEVD